MIQKTFCSNCNCSVKYMIEKRDITSFRGVELNTFEYVAICKNCEEDISVFELDDENLKRLYREYKIATGMVLPEEIVRFRRKYDISGIELAAVLGWDRRSIHRYENGGLQPDSRNGMLRHFICNPEYFVNRLKAAFAENSISYATYNRIHDCI